MTTGAKSWLPAIPHWPGRNQRPDDSIFEPLKSGLNSQLSVGELASSAAFAGGLNAYALRYFWEAHELWEAVWRCLPPASAERHLLRGLIQLANADLKSDMGRHRAAARILTLADDSLREAFLHGRDRLMGLSCQDITELRSCCSGSEVQYNA